MINGPTSSLGVDLGGRGCSINWSSACFLSLYLFCRLSFRISHLSIEVTNNFLEIKGLYFAGFLAKSRVFLHFSTELIYLMNRTNDFSSSPSIQSSSALVKAFSAVTRCFSGSAVREISTSPSLWRSSIQVPR